MVDVLGINFHDGSIQIATSTVIETCLSSSKREARCISATGAHGLVLAKQNEDFARVLKKFSLNLPDGMPSVWIGRLKGAKKMERCYGPDVLANVLEQSADKPIKHFFCGGKDGVAKELKVVAEQKFNNKNCVGTFSPPFREMTDEELRTLAHQIKATGADIVWIGMSTPKQEIFAKRLSAYVNVHCIITVGAAFDFLTGCVKQAPRFLQRIGMEWLFRLVMEPRRLLRRYLKIVPLFLMYAAMDLFNHRRTS